MKPSEVLRNVAKRVEDNPNEAWNGLCGIIESEADWNDNVIYVAKNYLVLFGKPDKDGYWFGHPNPSYLSWYAAKGKQDLRILAACFAAAMAESEGN